MKDFKNLKLKDLKYPLEASARTALYFIPALSTHIFLGRSKDPAFKKYRELFPLQTYFKEVIKLYEQDSENISQGFYLAPRSLLPKLKEYGLMNFKNALDLFKVKDRIRKKNVSVSTETETNTEFPAYFKQSFHYQSDGYLSAESAELYDHQVELVFSGTADAMRRHAIKALSLARKIDSYPSDAQIKILDIGCGTGHFAVELKRHFPLSEVTGLDLSPFYLKKAENKFPDSGVQWKSGKAEELPFADNSLDVVSSVFLFHELPEAVRKQAAQEMLRVLKPGGTLVHMDSLQTGDSPHLDSSLEIFPKLYHEPFYKNYIAQKSEVLFEEMGLKNIEKENAFYSKIVRGTKE